MVQRAAQGSLVLLDRPEQWESTEIQRAWWDLMPADRVNTLYASPSWFAHRVWLRPGRQRLLAVYRGPGGEVQGVVPIGVSPYVLRFDVGNGDLGRIAFKAVNVLGGEPLLPADGDVHDQLLEAMIEQVPDAECIYLEDVPAEGFCWSHLHDSQALRRQFVVHAVDHPLPRPGVWLPDDVDAFWKRVGSRRRNEFRRKIKRLEQAGDVRLERIERPEQVPEYLAAVAQVSARSWQHSRLGKQVADTPQERTRLMDLARRGLLRSYLLRCGGEPAAFTLAYQFRGVYYGIETAYDQGYGERQLAPGFVLHLRLIEDMIADGRIRYLDFGNGDYGYKRVFGNHEYPEASVLLLRRTVANRLVAISHRMFRGSVQQAKRWYQQLRR